MNLPELENFKVATILVHACTRPGQEQAMTLLGQNGEPDVPISPQELGAYGLLKITSEDTELLRERKWGRVRFLFEIGDPNAVEPEQQQLPDASSDREVISEQPNPEDASR